MNSTTREPNGSELNAWCSLITVTYNSSAALSEFWDVTDTLPTGVEWIVVDNGSTDGSAALAKKLGASRVIENEKNLGFSASNNIGLAHASGSFIGFVNPDVRVNFADLQSLRDLANSEKAIVSPQLLNADGSLQPNGRGFPLLLDKVRNRLRGSEALHGRYLLFADGTEPRNVCWVMGASAFGMRSTIESFGAWDDHFFLYYEDKDFCLRAWRAGVPVLLDPRSSWPHGWARETTEFNLAPWKRELASMAKFYWRYPAFLMPRKIAEKAYGTISQRVFGTA